MDSRERIRGYNAGAGATVACPSPGLEFWNGGHELSKSGKYPSSNCPTMYPASTEKPVVESKGETKQEKGVVLYRPRHLTTPTTNLQRGERPAYTGADVLHILATGGASFSVLHAYSPTCQFSMNRLARAELLGTDGESPERFWEKVSESRESEGREERPSDSA
ncbi:hypothetical protein FB45DRAFT_1068138 [Roridomyces roridus]|uniref:Uncharacterized protein n=1 Tax=Roridomyces roridus TaxID=1738132 RepID=A0AAD7B151_9AGAR|nr:hypothetical protein FB45DRAFT_1068138 [Roridomyces roridus]